MQQTRFDLAQKTIAWNIDINFILSPYLHLLLLQRHQLWVCYCVGLNLHRSCFNRWPLDFFLGVLLQAIFCKRRLCFSVVYNTKITGAFQRYSFLYLANKGQIKLCLIVNLAFLGRTGSLDNLDSMEVWAVHAWKLFCKIARTLRISEQPFSFEVKSLCRSHTLLIFATIRAALARIPHKFY